LRGAPQGTLSRLDYSLKTAKAPPCVGRLAVQNMMAILLYTLFFASGAAALIF
jgi:hypothetical protein